MIYIWIYIHNVLRVKRRRCSSSGRRPRVCTHVLYITSVLGMKEYPATDNKTHVKQTRAAAEHQLYYIRPTQTDTTPDIYIYVSFLSFPTGK